MCEAFFFLCTVFLASCQSEPEFDELNLKDRLDVVDSSWIIDSTALFPNCIVGTKDKSMFGCNNVFFGRYIKESPESAITISIDPTQVLITNRCTSFHLPHAGIDVSYEIARAFEDSTYFNYCTDVVRSNFGTNIKYEAFDGLLSIASNVDTVFTDLSVFSIRAKIEGTQFNIQGEDSLINDLEFIDIIQGPL